LLGKWTQGLFQTFEGFEFRATFTDLNFFRCLDLDGKKKIAVFMLKKCLLSFWQGMSQGDIVGHILCPLYHPALLLYTCFCAYNMQARSTANGKIRREIQNPQMFETDPESFSPAIYFTHALRSPDVRVGAKLVLV
jgi:hypothetical protein